MKKKTTNNSTDVRQGTADNKARAARTLTLDVEKYQTYLDDADLTGDQKEEFLKALWSIIVAFVDLGFGISPLQKIDTASCGKDEKADALPAKAVRALLSCEHSKHQQAFGSAAKAETVTSQEGRP